MRKEHADPAYLLKAMMEGELTGGVTTGEILCTEPRNQCYQSSRRVCHEMGDGKGTNDVVAGSNRKTSPSGCKFAARRNRQEIQCSPT